MVISALVVAKEWRCLGMWRDPTDPHKIYSAISDDQESLFENKVSLD